MSEVGISIRNDVSIAGVKDGRVMIVSLGNIEVCIGELEADKVGTITIEEGTGDGLTVRVNSGDDTGISILGRIVLSDINISDVGIGMLREGDGSIESDKVCTSIGELLLETNCVVVGRVEVIDTVVVMLAVVMMVEDGNTSDEVGLRDILGDCKNNVELSGISLRDILGDCKNNVELSGISLRDILGDCKNNVELSGISILELTSGVNEGKTVVAVGLGGTTLVSTIDVLVSGTAKLLSVGEGTSCVDEGRSSMLDCIMNE